MENVVKRSGVPAFVRAPLLHFLVLGGVAFAAWSVTRTPESLYEEPGRHIAFSARRIAALREGWSRKRQRPPTEKELRGLIDSVVREEILAREAIALGLDQDDTIVRRRLAQKMDSMARELLTPRDPTDEELQAFLEETPDRFRRPARIGFRHVFFSPDRRGSAAEADAKRALVELRKQPDMAIENVGDAVMLPAEVDLESETVVANRFGPEFVADLAKAPAGEWSGPVASAFGLHLVFLTGRRPSALPALEEVRAVVARDFAVARRETATGELYRLLRKEYRVEVDEEAFRAALAESPR